MTTIKIQLLHYIFHLVHLITQKNVLCIKQLGIGQQITLSKSVIT